MSDDRGPKEQLYDEQVSPLMAKVIALCKEAKINMAAQFALDQNDEDQTIFCTTCLCNVDPDDQEGVERMENLRKIMFPPNPHFAAFTIYSTKVQP